MRDFKIQEIAGSEAYRGRILPLRQRAEVENEWLRTRSL
jgi:hypothetical protein